MKNINFKHEKKTVDDSRERETNIDWKQNMQINTVYNTQGHLVSKM